MPAAWLLASRDLRRRAAAWALLAVLIGLLGATALATAAGARRSASAFSRFIHYSHDADADVLGFGAPPGALDRVAALPQVAKAFKASLVPIVPSGPQESRFDNGLIVSEDEGFLDGTIVRPTFLEGRRPELSDPNEVAVNESMASRTGVHAGRSLTFGVLSEEQLERAGQGEALGAPEGPRITVRVAGVMRLPSDLAQTASQGIVYASGAFYRTWASRLSLDTSLLAVSLRSPALRPAFARAAVPLLGGATLQFRDDRVVTDATRVQAVGLAAVSGIVAVCALVALGQALTRAGALSDTELAARTAVGLTRRQRMWASALPALCAIAAGAVLAVVLAFLASGLFPRGVAGRAEPTPGLHADLAVLVLGGLAVLVTIGAWVLVASRLAVSGRRRLPSRASWSSRVTERTSLGVGPALGVRFALERGRGGRATPTTSSVAAAVVGVAGVIGVTVFGGSLGHLFSTPALAGAPWDAEISTIPGPFLHETEGMVDTPAFAGVAAVRTLEVVVGGAATEGYSFDVRRGSGFLTVLDGRAPVSTGEAALGSRTLRRMGLSIGDTVGVSGPSGRRVSARVVGRVALPVLDTDIDRISDGVVLSSRAIDVLAAGDDDRSGTVLVQFADPAGARQRLGAVARRFGLPGIPPPPEPREVSNMRPVRGLLGAIGVLTGLLAALSVVHLLVTGVRRRRGDLAILRALGLSPGEARSVIRWQSVTVAAVAAGLGVPAGVVVGRAAWTTVAGQLGVAGGPVVRLLLLAAVAGVFVAGTLAVATIPGRRAAALRPAAVLRAD